MRHTDPYIRLRPHEPSPNSSVCCCRELTTIYLAHVFTQNPIHCSLCGGAVAPERVGFDACAAGLLASWNTVYASIYELWLESGEYESWAESQLLCIDSPVNTNGLQAREKLSKYIPCRYLWFWQGTRPDHCPLCGSGSLEAEGVHLLCSACAIYV